MRTLWKRLLSGFLSLVLLVTLVPTAAFAANDSGSVAAEPVSPFMDVKKGDWFYDAVLYAYANGFFSGTTATTYEPQGTMTRGMFVTVLGRMAGVDPADYSGGTDFSDVNVNKYYAPYIEWAVKYGIVTGYSDGTFHPDAKVTRQQMAAFFVRYFEAFDVDYETGANITTTPADLASVSAYAQDAVLKLWKQGLLNGDGKNFNPGGNASRAQAATLCMRADKAVDTWYSEPGVPSERVSVDPAEQQPEQTEEEKKPNSTSSSSGSSSRGSYTITLHTDTSTDTMTQTSSTLRLDNLPKPAPEGYYFLGWYYDEAYTRQALDGDTLTSTNTALYAKTLKSGEIETSETPYSTAKTDVEDNFTITVKSTSDVDLTDKITVSGPAQYADENLTPDEMKVLIVTKNSNGTYTISGPNGKLVPGGAYQVTLEDDALTFVDENGTPMAASIREYHFTVKQSERVMNLRLKDDVTEIPISEIGNSAQLATQSLVPVAVLAGENGSVTTNSAANSGTTGSFTYTGSEELKVGDTVAIYEGSKPSDRDADSDDLSEVSYVTITGKTGTNTYTYTAADAEDVLFMPDVLPVKASHKDNTGNTATVPVSELTYTTTNGNLGPDTTVDVGDFLAFYEGESTETATSVTYGRITSVSTSSGKYNIGYETVEESVVDASMDFSTTNNVSGEELLKGTDQKKMEENIAQQAVDSGFAQVVAQNLAAAVSTMDLSELEDGELDLSDVDLGGLSTQDLSFGALQSASVATYANEPGGSSAPEVKIEGVSASISKDLTHFEGKSGVQITLTMTVTIEFDAGEENESITIEVTPTFVQELKLDISSDGGIVWKKWFIFKYIYDFYASVSVDMYTYTSINLSATISSGGEDDTVSKVQNMVDKLKGEEEVAMGISDLQDLYCEMLENDTEWITLYRKTINEQKWSVAKGFIEITLTIDFVVQANVNISLGLQFDYENAKRYNYTVYIFHGKSTNNTINLVTENYNLQLYAMGVLGIRAGVEVSLSVALISKKVASVGVVINVGAYLKVYGYVIYTLRHVAGKTDESSGSGALYIEVGCYLDIGLDLSAFGGKLSWQPTLYANEWPLWTAGSSLAVRGFAATQDEDGNEVEPPTVYMRRGQTTIDIPSELRTMAGFSMRTGEDASVAYDLSYFDVSFSDSRFKLENGKITLNFGDGVTWKTYPDDKLECDMTITWKGAPLSFNTETLQLKTTVHWDRYNDYCMAIFDVQGANIKIENQKLKSTDTLTIPDMTNARPGYEFLGWKVERTLPNESTTTDTALFNGTSIELNGCDLRLTAQWKAREDVAYTIIPMLQQTDGTYKAGKSYTKYDGRVDTYIFPTLNDIDGYVTPSVGGYYINADGKTEIAVNYTLKSYLFTVVNGDTTSFRSYRYNDDIDWTEPTRAGYTFDDWYTDENFETAVDLTKMAKMPANDVKIYGKWTANTDTPYTAYIYTQNEDGSYKLDQTLNNKGTTDAVMKTDKADSTVNGTIFDLPVIPGYTVRDNCKNITITIAGDGSAAANYYYDLNHNWLTIVHKSDNGKVNDTEELGVLGATVPASAKNFAGYTLDGYYTDEACTAANKLEEYPKTLTESTTLYAKWTPNTVSYKVEHYQQNLDGSYPETPTDTETITTGHVDDTVTPDCKTYGGFTAPGETQFTLTATAANNVIPYKYTRNSYTLTLNTNGGNKMDPMTVKFGDTVNPGTPTRSGYTFGGWYKDSGCTEENKLATDATMLAEALTLYAKWTANSGTAYKVEHWQQNTVGDEYTLYETDTTLTGTTGEDTVAAANTYTGFTAKSFEQETIAGDGSTVVKVYYTRNEYKLTYNLNTTEDASFNSSDASVTARYGATVSLPTMQDITYTGHSLEGWYTDAACTDGNKVTSYVMSDEESQTLYANWTVSNTSYTVKVYLQNVNDGGYTESSKYSYTEQGTFGATAPAPQDITGFDTPTASDKTLTMDADDNVIEYRYDRNSYKVTWDAKNDETTHTTSTFKYEAPVTAPTTDPTKTGYTFAGWYTDSGLTKELTDDYTMPAAATTLYAKWTPITYTLRFNPLGNVPLKNWLKSVGGKETENPSDEYGYYTYNGIPYIDITLKYNQKFTFPAADATLTVDGASYTLTDIGVTDLLYYDASEQSSYSLLGTTVEKLTAEDSKIVGVSITWKEVKGDYDDYSGTPIKTDTSNPALIYNYSQLMEILSNSYLNPYSRLMVDLEVNNQASSQNTVNTNEESGGWFDGNNHTIKALKCTASGNGVGGNGVGGLVPGFGENFIVKDLTIDGVTIDCDANGTMYYGAYGGLFGYVGKGFTMTNVTVKGVNMTLKNLSATGSYSYDQATRIAQDCVGGLIGYAAGTVTLTNCSIDGLTIDTSNSTSNPVVGSLIGYVDALDESTFVDGGYTWTFESATVTLTDCSVTTTGSMNKVGGTYEDTENQVTVTVTESTTGSTSTSTGTDETGSTDGDVTGSPSAANLAQQSVSAQTAALPPVSTEDETVDEDAA